MSATDHNDCVYNCGATSCTSSERPVEAAYFVHLHEDALEDRMMDNTVNGTVKDFARLLLRHPISGYHVAEIATEIDGKNINMECIITFIDGVQCAPMFNMITLPFWKLWIKRVLSL